MHWHTVCMAWHSHKHTAFLRGEQNGGLWCAVNVHWHVVFMLNSTDICWIIQWTNLLCNPVVMSMYHRHFGLIFFILRSLCETVRAFLCCSQIQSKWLHSDMCHWATDAFTVPFSQIESFRNLHMQNIKAKCQNTVVSQSVTSSSSSFSVTDFMLSSLVYRCSSSAIITETHRVVSKCHGFWIWTNHVVVILIALLNVMCSPFT